MNLLTLTATRVRMAGNFPTPQCAYDVEVHTSQLTAYQLAECRYFIDRHGERYAMLYEAFLPDGYEALRGAERARAFAEARRKAAKAREIVLNEAFAETRGAPVCELWQPAPLAAAKDATVEVQIDVDQL